jgi:hypothetical protein
MAQFNYFIATGNGIYSRFQLKRGWLCRWSLAASPGPAGETIARLEYKAIWQEPVIKASCSHPSFAVATAQILRVAAKDFNLAANPANLSSFGAQESCPAGLEQIAAPLPKPCCQSQK